MLGVIGSQMKALDPVKLELLEAVSCHVGTGN